MAEDTESSKLRKAVNMLRFLKKSALTMLDSKLFSDMVAAIIILYMLLFLMEVAKG